MRRPSSIFVLLMTTILFGVLGITSSKGQSRENPRESDSTPRFRAVVALVSLDVCVRDAWGRFVPDLSADDFVVLEDGKPQQVVFLDPSSGVPLTAVLLIDISQSMYGPKLTRAIEAAKQFAGLLGPDDRLAIVAFSQRAMRIHAFGDEPSHVATALSSSIHELLISPEGAPVSTALYDALLVAANELTRARGGQLPETREVIVLLSDGEDNSSIVGFDEVLPVLRRSRALVYSISLQANDRGEWLGANWPMVEMARDTGARALGVPSLEALPGLYQEINAEVRHLYRLAYVSSDNRHDGQWRSVSVRVTSHDARVRTRAGYYASRPVASPILRPGS